MAFTTIDDGVPLFSGEFPRVIVGVELTASTGTVAVGDILGKVTATGKYKKYAAGSSDGSQTPLLIAGAAADTSDSAQLDIPAYRTGEFNKNKISNVTDAAIAALDARSIFIREV